MNVKGLNIVIGADASNFNKAMSDINSTTSGLNRELRDVNRSLKFDTKNPELLAQKTKILNERFTETQKKLQLLEAAQKDVKKAFDDGKIDESEYRKHQTEIMQTKSKLESFEKQLKSAEREMLKYDGTLGKATASLEKAGDGMTKAGKKIAPASAVAAGGLGLLFKASMDFDSAWVGVQKTMSDDITPEQLENIKVGLKNLSKEIGVSTTELATVAEAAGQLGIETENILDFTKVMVDMGKATNLSSDVAATTLARFAKVTQMSQKDFGRLGSTIVELGNNFETTEAEIAAMALNLGSAGTQIGMTQSDILALATSLSSVGLEAAGGGTAFSKLMVQMQLAAIQGGDTLADFASVAGMTGKEFQEAFEDNATGALQAFINGLSKTGEQGQSAIKVLDDMGIKETRLRDALLRSANASDSFTDAIAMGSKAWEENTALTNEAEQRYNSVQGKLDKMKQSFNVMAINLGDKLLPVMTSFFDWVAKVADKFGDLDDGTQKLIVGIAGAVAVAGPALIIGGKVATGLGSIIGLVGSTGKALGLIKTSGAIASTAIGGVGTATATAAGSTGLMAGVVGGLGKAFTAMTGPVGLGAAAVVGAGYLIVKSIKEEVVPAVDLFADGFDTASAKIDEFGNLTEVTTIKISEETKEMLGSYLEMSEGISDTVTALYIGVEEVNAEGMGVLKEQTNEMVTSILEKNTERKNEELAIMTDLFENAQGMTEKSKEEINSIIAEDYYARENKTLELQTELEQIYNDISNQASGATLEQKQKVEDILDALKVGAVDIMTQDEAERAVILNRMKDYGTRITAEQASEIVTQLEKQKQSTVAKAGETRDEQIRIAEDLRAKGGYKAEQTANKIIEEANKQYRGQVDMAEAGKKDGLDKLGKAYEDLSSSVDTETGKMLTNGQKFKNWWDNLFFPKKTAVVETQNYSRNMGDMPHNNGLLNVPYNGYSALLHRDERVLTAYENRKYKRDGYLGNPQLAKANKSVSNIDNSTVNNIFTLGGTYHIREESDINKLAQELHRLTLRKARA